MLYEGRPFSSLSIHLFFRLTVLSTSSISFDTRDDEDEKTTVIRNGFGRIHKDTRVFLLHGGYVDCSVGWFISCYMHDLNGQNI